MSSTIWRRVNKADPCPICGKDHACKVSADGAVALCKRIERGAFKASKGWYFHRLKESSKSDYVGQAHRPTPTPSAQAHRVTKAYPNPQAAIDAAGKLIGGSFVAGWTYHNRDGSEALRVIRYALADGNKEYRPIYPAKDGWRIGDPSGMLPLYRLNDLPADGLLWVTEGEKAADAARNIGLAATTSAHGAGAAEKTDWTPLAGRQACILPDADESGRKYAQDVARLLVKLDTPAKVRIIELPGLLEKGDVVEYLDARPGQAPEAIRAEVEAMATKSVELDPADLIGGPVSVCLADVEAKEISWLWPGRVPSNCITLVIGKPKEGKSFATIDIAARMTTGSPWPDGSGNAPKGSVIFITAEDDPARVIRPRLNAHHADCRKVHLLSAVRRIDANGKAHDVLFTLADVSALEKEIRKHPDCKLIVVDPIGSFLGGKTDAHRDNEVRAVLAPVAKLAEKYGMAVLVVAHRRKGAGNSADDMALGSRAFTGLARTNWHLIRDPENKARRLLLPGGGNYFDDTVNGLAFTIQGPGNQAMVVWEREPVAMSADDALAAENGNSDGEDGQPGPEPQAMNAAKQWLSKLLADGEVEAAKVKAEAHDAGLAWRTVQRAADALGVIREKNTFNGGWQWRFPKPGIWEDEDAKPPKSMRTWHLGILGRIKEKTAIPCARTPKMPSSLTLASWASSPQKA